MPLIRVLAGSYRRADGTRAEPGDTIEVEEETLDRLVDESYEVVETTPEPETDSESEEESVETTPEPETDSESEEESVEEEPESEAGYEPPEDYAVLRKMAALADTEEVHGSTAQEELEAFFGDADPDVVEELEQAAREELAE